jgi:MFS family permease
MDNSASGITIEMAEEFRLEAIKEIDREQKMLDNVNSPRRGFTIGWIIAIVFLGLACIALFLNEAGFLFWVMISFILYGFNFLIWFLPTTRNKADEAEKKKLNVSKEALKKPIRYILKKKKGLGVEIGMTMFLSGMVPLALSFFVLFGIGLIFGVYFGFIRNLYDQTRALAILFQILVILFFFVILLVLKPQERGFVKTARRFKGKIGSARSRGKVAGMFFIALAGLFVAALGLLFIGAILAPGGTWNELWEKLRADGDAQLIILILVFIAEVVIMRHFQAVSGRRMARKLLAERIGGIKEGAVDPLDKVIAEARAAHRATVEGAVLESAKTSFYSIVIYDIFEHNFFGYNPVYVVGPRVSYLLDEEALAHIK